jgi:hypothetical protein
LHLKTLPLQLSLGKSDSYEVFFSAAFWFRQGFLRFSRIYLIRDRFRFHGLVTVITASLDPKPWDLFSYPNAHEITPLEIFPPKKGYEPYGTYHPLIALAKRQGTGQLRTDLPKSTAFRVLALRRSPCSSGGILLPLDSRSSCGVSPSRV